MTKNFLTISQAADKLKATASGTDFITKNQLLELGANEDSLSSYSGSEYPVDDDIIPGSAVVDILRISEDTGTLKSENGYLAGAWEKADYGDLNCKIVQKTDPWGNSDRYWSLDGEEKVFTLWSTSKMGSLVDILTQDKYGIAIRYYAEPQQTFNLLNFGDIDSEPIQNIYHRVDNYITTNGPAGYNDFMDSVTNHNYLFIIPDPQQGLGGSIGMYSWTRVQNVYEGLNDLEKILNYPYTNKEGFHFIPRAVGNGIYLRADYIELGGVYNENWIPQLNHGGYDNYHGTKHTYIGDIEVFKLSALDK